MHPIAEQVLKIAPNTYADVSGVTVVRLTDFAYGVLWEGQIVRFGGTPERLTMTATRVAELITGERLKYPCARCGVGDREVTAYCRKCRNEMQQEYDRDYRRRVKMKETP